MADPRCDCGNTEPFQKHDWWCKARRKKQAMTQEQDIVERLLEICENDDHERGCNGREYDCTCGFDERTFATAKEAAQTIAALRAERDTSARGWGKAFDDMHQRAMAAEAHIKELEAEISNFDAELDHWSQLAVDDLGKNPPTSWKEIADTAIRERDELRKALEPFAMAADELDDKDEDHYELWEHSVAMSITVGDLRRARSASSNREGGE